eukprot:gene11670-8045_t
MRLGLLFDRFPFFFVWFGGCSFCVVIGRMADAPMSAAAKKKLKEKLRKERVKERQEAVARLQAKVLGRGSGVAVSSATTTRSSAAAALRGAPPPPLVKKELGGEHGGGGPPLSMKDERCATADATGDETSMPPDFDVSSLLSSIFGGEKKTTEPEEEEKEEQRQPSAEEEATTVEESQRAEGPSRQGFSSSAASRGRGDVHEEEEGGEEEEEGEGMAYELEPLAPDAARMLRAAAAGSGLVEAGRRYLEEQEEKAKAAAGEKEDDEKATKMSWNMLKLKVLEAYGKAGLRPCRTTMGMRRTLFTVDMKLLHRRSVPVPRHWLATIVSLTRPIARPQKLCHHRCSCSGREDSGDPRQGSRSDLAAPLRCFFSGTRCSARAWMSIPPFLCNTIGDLFHEGRRVMMPEPLSSSLKEALGMPATAPPPWLYEMQSLGRLPPAYPHLRIPGLNAPHS